MMIDPTEPSPLLYSPFLGGLSLERPDHQPTDSVPSCAKETGRDRTMSLRGILQRFLIH